MSLVGLFSAYTSIHKYYISNTQIEYVANKQSVQIITRVFVDDIETVLRERYELYSDENLLELSIADAYIETYFKEKFRLKIDSTAVIPKYLGKEINGNIVKFFLEIERVKHINVFEISNEILFDLFSEQQNIIKLDINKIQKSYMLTKQNPKAFLSF
jgi:hypothetical protein